MVGSTLETMPMVFELYNDPLDGKEVPVKGAVVISGVAKLPRSSGCESSSEEDTDGAIDISDLFPLPFTRALALDDGTLLDDL